MIPISIPSITDEEIKLVTDAVKSTWVSSIGIYLEKFENILAEFHDISHAITTSSGTTALHLALLASGIKPGSKVGVPRVTFAASVNAILYCNAIPIIIDCDGDSCMEFSDFEKVADHLDAIILVHLNGNCGNLNKILKLCKKFSIEIIEDAAEAIGCEYNKKKLGTFGTAGILSFYGNKTITTGEGGCILTNSDEVAKKARHLRDHSMDSKKRYFHDRLGFNYRMTNLQAALGFAQMKRIDQISKERRRILNFYINAFDKLQLKNMRLITPHYQEINSLTPWLIQIDISSNKSVDQVMNLLKEKNIDSRPMFSPIDTFPYIKNNRNLKPSKTSGNMFLPLHDRLKESDVIYIVENLAKILKNENMLDRS